MPTSLNELYFHWLTNQVHFEYRHHNTTTYFGLMQLLHNTEFVWFVPNDDNRLQDGLELRYLFLQDEEQRKITGKLSLEKIAIFRSPPCTMLEVIVALSGRLAFQAGGEAGWWAWKLIENIGLHKMRDPFGPSKTARTEEVLHHLIWRTYKWDGAGGFFPLAFPQEDQTKVELWYQMAAYLQEFYRP